jgi:uncharacterized damage-inducible protein DinB
MASRAANVDLVLVALCGTGFQPVSPRSAATDVDLLLVALERAYKKRSWHGPNLRGALRGVSAREASSRVSPRRKCIAEHCLHAAYWKYTVMRRLAEEEVGSFPMSGSNWVGIESPLREQTWRDYLKLLDQMHQRLRAAVERLVDRDLEFVPPGSKVSNRDIILGIIAHDIYHAGQIGLLKRLLRDTGD